jgi:hypothetical protein
MTRRRQPGPQPAEPAVTESTVREVKQARGRVERASAPARKAIGSIRSGMAAAADGMAAAADGVAAAAEPIVDRIEQAVDDVERAISERPGRRVRRVRRMGAAPLPYLNDVHPDVARAHPVQVGLRTIPVADIAGTAVGGGAQRGGDFLPLRPFRGKNWAGRWQRLNRAQNELAILPPIDVVKHGGTYWVVDGHNRVGLALYAGQPEIDASIVELVPPGERRTEPILTLAPTVSGSRAVRTAAAGHRPSELLSHEDGIRREPVDDGR